MTAGETPEPGRILVVGTDSGWRLWEDKPPGYAGELILPNGSLADCDPQDAGVVHDIRRWSIRDPRVNEQET
jgi:hypothetical protein